MQHGFHHSLCSYDCYSLNRWNPVIFTSLGSIPECFSLKWLHFPLLTQIWSWFVGSDCVVSMNWWERWFGSWGLRVCLCVLWWACVFLTGAGAGAVESVAVARALPASPEAPLIQRRRPVAPAAQAGLQDNTLLHLFSKKKKTVFSYSNCFLPGNSS